MQIDDGGWLIGVRRVASPNCDARPCAIAPSLLVIHGISLPPGQFDNGRICALFTNSLPADECIELHSLRVSAHLLIQRNGCLIQFVSFLDRAWHAGESSFGERTHCNDFSIGIELEGTDDIPYEPVQYRVLGDVSRTLMQRWRGITKERIVGHSDIAPRRKTDPGPAFRWEQYFAALGA